MSILLQARGLVQQYGTAKSFLGRKSVVRAVDGIDLTVRKGEILGIVGESGSGKSTLARALIGLVPATGQAFCQDGTDLIGLTPRKMLKYRREIQMVFQDPLASLNPRMTVGQIIAEPLTTHHKGLGRDEVKRRVKDMMDRVGLLPNQINRYPHEFSGGQCQRIGIARALIVQPKLVICDEPVSALDVSIQAQVVNLLRDLQERNGLTMVFISHDLKVVRNICDRVAVMYLGRVVEEAPSDVIFSDPRHPYTQALVSSVPRPGQGLEGRILLQGEPPNPAARPSGCAFHPRCRLADAHCAGPVPQLRDHQGRLAACLKLSDRLQPAA